MVVAHSGYGSKSMGAPIPYRLLTLLLSSILSVLAIIPSKALAAEIGVTAAHGQPVGGYVAVQDNDFTAVPLPEPNANDMLATQSDHEDTVSLESFILSCVATRSKERHDIVSYGISCDEFSSMYASIIDSHPELFDVLETCAYSYYASSGTVVSFTPRYHLSDFDDEAVIRMRYELACGVAEAMSWVPANGTDLQKVKAAHDWLASNVEYDYDVVNDTSSYVYWGTKYGVIAEDRAEFYPWCAYGALVARSSVCQGYAGAFQLLMDLLDIPCTTVSANNHAWNRVCIDGSWYHVDTTWDAGPGVPYTNYFMKSDKGVAEQDVYTVYYEDDGVLTHTGYGAAEVAGTDERYDSWSDSNWRAFWQRLEQLDCNKVTSFKLSQSEVALDAGATQMLVAQNVVPSEGNPFMATWSSSNPKVFYVFADGTLAAIADEGTATITCNLGNATRTCAAAIRQPLTDAVVESIPDQVCTGYALTPKVAIRLGSRTLVEGVDYKVAYENNITVGHGTAIITGIGKYSGYIVANFDIVAPSFVSDGWVDLASGEKGYARGGKLVTGWMDLGSAKYYFQPDGSMSVGWNDVEVDGKDMHYYFNPASGNLVRSTWFTIEGVNYYFRPSGNLATGWATIDDNGTDKKYYFREDGSLVNGTWYDVVNDNGVTNHYYFRPAGSMATGWATIEGRQYFFRPSGNMATGWADVTNDGGATAKHYFDEGGVMLVGWQEIGGRTYYFRPSGAMQTGAATIDGKAYRFSDKGVLVG